jgi:hypothetical protein
VAGFQYDEAALLRFEAALAEGIHDWAANEAVSAIAALAPRGDGRRDRKKWPVPYHRTIRATTFHRGRIVGGRPVRGRAVRSKAEIWTIVYTGDARGVWLERGVRPHDVSRRDAVVTARGNRQRVKHPGARRRPHFGIGILAARSLIAPSMRGAVVRRFEVR